MKKEIIIAWGGNCWWITALFTRQMFPKDFYNITVIASEEIWTIGVGESSVPYVVNFLKSLWLQESEILSHCNGTIKTWVLFKGWNRDNTFIHPFTSGLSSLFIGEKPFAYWYHANGWTHFGRDIDMGDILVKENLVPFDTNLTPHYEYAYHLDANLLWKYVKNLCLQIENNITYKNEFIESVEKNDNIITKIVTSQNTYSPDLVFDCSGFHEIIINKYLENPHISFKKDLPCDKALFSSCDAIKQMPNYTLSETMDAWWRWEIPLQKRTWIGYVFSDNYCSIEQAKEEFSKKTSTPIDKMKLIHFKSGYRKQSWIWNTISIWSSYGFVEPLEWTGIYLFCKQLTEFKKAYISDLTTEKKQSTYNSLMEKELLEVRDFIHFHYYWSQKRDTPFWNYFKNPSWDKQITLKREFLESNFPDQSFDTPHNVFKKESYTRVLIALGFYENFQFTEAVNPQTKLEIKRNLINMLHKKYLLKNSFLKHKDFIDQITK